MTRLSFSLRQGTNMTIFMKIFKVLSRCYIFIQYHIYLCHGLLKIRPYMSHFRKIIRDQFFKYEASDNIEYCNDSLLFYVIFCNLFSILILLYCLRLFVKKKIKTKSKRKMCSFHNDGKKFQHKEIKNSCI